MFDNKGVSDYIFRLPKFKQVNNTQKPDQEEASLVQRKRDWFVKSTTVRDDDYTCIITKIHTICTLRAMVFFRSLSPFCLGTDAHLLTVSLFVLKQSMMPKYRILLAHSILKTACKKSSCDQILCIISHIASILFVY